MRLILLLAAWQVAINLLALGLYWISGADFHRCPELSFTVFCGILVASSAWLLHLVATEGIAFEI